MRKWTGIAVFVFCLCLIFGAMADTYQSGDFMGPNNDTAVVISRNLTIREEATTRGKKVTSVNNGAILTVYETDEKGDWLLVDYTDSKGELYSGWVLAKYTIRNPLIITLLTGNVPAYSAPTTKSKLVGSLDKNTELTVIGEWGNFYIVNLRQASAYILKSTEMETNLVSDFTHGLTATTLSDTLLRSGPGKNWNTIVVIPTNTLVLVEDMADGWVQVQYGTYTGFVPAEDLDLPMDQVDVLISDGVG